MSDRLVLGTRGSALALAQVALVIQELNRVQPALHIEVKRIATSGDRRAHAAALESGAGMKGMFTKEIEEALLAGEIDVAVHSCKDLPGQLSAGCEIRAVLQRAPTDDILIAKSAGSFRALASGARIGTSSVRRRRQLLWLRADFTVEEMRGNVPTRLRILRESDSFDAIVLARAGLERLGHSLRDGWLEFEGTKFHAEILPFLPAIGQGAIALEGRADDGQARKILEEINHAPTFPGIRAERELLRLLDGDCRLPVGAKTELDGAILRMQALLFRAENAPPQIAETSGRADEPEQIARAIFQKLTPTPF